MDNDQKKLDSVKPLEFTWSSDGANMSSGFIAQEIDIANITTTNYGAAGPVYTIDSVGTDTIDLSGITIGGSSGGNFSFTSSMPTNSISGVNEINTANGKRIDLEELADVVETIKKRLLILAPWRSCPERCRYWRSSTPPAWSRWPSLPTHRPAPSLQVQPLLALWPLGRESVCR